MMRVLGTIVTAVFVAPCVGQRLRSQSARGSNCSELQVAQDFNITEYLRASWYIQKQQVNGYQPEERLYCVVATYNETFRGKKSRVPFFFGTVVTVFNDCNVGGKNAQVSNNYTAPDFKRGFSSPLCARQRDPKEPAKLSVAPCLLPNFLAGDYWIVEAGPRPNDYQWAIIMAGQPTVEFEDGCTTPDTCSGPAQTGCGFWLVTRDPQPAQAVVEDLESKARAKGLSTRLLKAIDHDGCKYDGYAIKPNMNLDAFIS